MKKTKLIFGIAIIIISVTFLGYKKYLYSGLTASKISYKDIIITALNPFPEKKEPDSVYLVVGGDIMLSRNIGLLGKQEGYDRIFGSGQYNPVNDFGKCNDENCILLFNLESLFYHPDNDIKNGGFMFRANTGNIETLLQLKGNKELILSLANNHTINGGYRGINMTRDLLNEYDIKYIGAGLYPDESRQISVINKNNIKICSQSYSYDGQYVKVGEGKISWNNLNEKDIIEDIQSMKYLDCDVNIVYLHWGSEYIIKPNRNQETLANNLIDAGADLILGSHSHVPGVFTKINDKYVFYSFGNFIFDQGRGKNTKFPNADYIYDHKYNRNTVATYVSLLGGFEITKDSSGTKINLDKTVMTEITKGLHSQIDNETYQEIYSKINKID